MAQKTRIKAAVIGSGNISERYIPNIINHFHIIDLVGCSDLIPERSKEKAEKYGIKQMTNEEILSDPEIEIVINLTYPLSHYEVTKAALEAGKHVYAEKMLAVTLDEGKELVELAKSKNLYYTAAPDTFLGGGWQTARYLIDSGFIGEPISAFGICIRSYQDHGENYREPKGFVFGGGGGIPFDMGGYYLHGFINLLGSMKRVSGFVKTRNATRIYDNPRHPKYKETFTIDSPNMLAGALEFQSGAIATLLVMSETSSFSQPQLEIQGSEGVLTLFDPNDFSGKIILRKSNMAEPVEMPIIHPYSEECRGIGVADMAYAIRNGRRARADCEMGYHAFEAVHGIWNSCKDGQVYQMQSTCPRPAPIKARDLNGTSREFMLDD